MNNSTMDARLVQREPGSFVAGVILMLARPCHGINGGSLVTGFTGWGFSAERFTAGAVRLTRPADHNDKGDGVHKRCPIDFVNES